MAPIARHAPKPKPPIKVGISQAKLKAALARRADISPLRIAAEKFCLPSSAWMLGKPAVREAQRSPRGSSFEALESRELMSATIDLSGGALTLHANPGVSSRLSVSLNQGGSEVVAYVSGAGAKKFPAADVTSIEIDGSGKNDSINVSKRVTIPVTIDEADGNNKIRAGAGVETIVCGNGNNRINGGDSDGSITVGNGKNAVKGGKADELIRTGNGNDRIYGDSGNDTIIAGDGKDRIVGGSGDDEVLGGNGKDFIAGGVGIDTIVAGTGDTTVHKMVGAGSVYRQANTVVVADRKVKIYDASASVGASTVAAGATTPSAPMGTQYPVVSSPGGSTVISNSPTVGASGSGSTASGGTNGAPTSTGGSSTSTGGTTTTTTGSSTSGSTSGGSTTTGGSSSGTTASGGSSSSSGGSTSSSGGSGGAGSTTGGSTSGTTTSGGTTSGTTATGGSSSSTGGTTKTTGSTTGGSTSGTTTSGGTSGGTTTTGGSSSSTGGTTTSGGSSASTGGSTTTTSGTTGSTTGGTSTTTTTTTVPTVADFATQTTLGSINPGTISFAGDTTHAVILATEPTGMANHTVHFNALSSKLAVGDSLDAQYAWNFGDAGSAFNTLTGWIGAHNYANAGTYTVTLTVTDSAGNVSVATTTVTIAADTRQVIYVDSVAGNDSNTGLNPDSAVASVARAAELLGPNTEVLFHNGQNFDVADTVAVVFPNVTIGTYGSGSAARFVKIAGNGTSIFNIMSGATDFVAEGIVLDSMWDMATYGTAKVGVRGFFVTGDNCSIIDCQFYNVDDAINTAGNPTGVLVQGNYFGPEIRGDCIWGQGYDQVYIGNTMTDSTQEHLIRTSGPGVCRLLIEDNNLSRTTPLKGSLELRTASFFNVIGNTVTNGTLRLGLPDGADSYFTGWGVVQGNDFTNIFTNIRPGAQHIELRDNVFNDAPGAAFNMEVNGSTDEPEITDIRIDNNTVIDSAQYAKFLEIDGVAADIAVNNNVFVDPNLLWKGDSTGAVYVATSDLSDFKQISDNVWPLPPAGASQAGDCYVYPEWGVTPEGFVTNAEWDKFPQVHDDQFANVDLAADVYDVTLNGTTAGALPSVFNPSAWSVAAAA